ncbi:hypothetical protein MDT00_002878 [Vibrio vulnificus]|nr:hypothetical protein [Vibrio vulnificus]EIZ1410816.1 hypothetical protein [Vibrio vulnificus]EJA3295845.1 hypothetical protein [Vibrio vulnificus]EKL0033148.1 hypothetical protein [Vibrio vulnificus]
MKAFKNPVALSTLLLLQACSTSAPVATQSAPPLPTANLSQPESVIAQSFMLSGSLVVGHEAQYITPCGSTQQYWLQLSTQQRQQLMALTSLPYQSMYGEVIGHLKTTGDEGFASEYDALFVVEQLNLVDASNPTRCEQAARPTQAFGNEPNWRIDFAANQLTIKQLSKQDQTREISRSQLSPRKREYQFDGGQLLLSENLCKDTMSNSLYGWKATFDWQDTQLSGCATTSNIDATLGWRGLYTATSTQSSGFSVHMQLNADHSAETRYLYANEARPLVEKGYWQQLNPNQIQVVMTHHQGQKLVTERIFTHTGSQLKAEKEKVGKVVYPIAQGGLILYPAAAGEMMSDAPITTQTVIPTDTRNVASSAEFRRDVDQAIREYFRLHKTDPSNNQYRWLTYDLNGDGKEELLAQLDWCGSGGCTLLIFENHQETWRFNSRITLVNTPIYLGNQRNHGWQDLIFNVRGGGAKAQSHLMQYDGISYPLNPSVAPVALGEQISLVELFSDGISPVREGVKL